MEISGAVVQQQNPTFLSLTKGEFPEEGHHDAYTTVKREMFSTPPFPFLIKTKEPWNQPQL